jgi:hypothetical protein
LTGVGAAAGGGVAAASNAAALAAAGYVRLTPVDTDAYGVRNEGVAAAAAASAAAAATGTTINVTVNGALNAEGTARTIVDTLNNSFYRGTGGANNLVTT